MHSWHSNINNRYNKFIAPNIEAIPAKCKLKIAKSTEAPE